MPRPCEHDTQSQPTPAKVRTDSVRFPELLGPTGTAGDGLGVESDDAVDDPYDDAVEDEQCSDEGTIATESDAYLQTDI